MELIFSNLFVEFRGHVKVSFKRIWAKFLGLGLDSLSKPLGRHLGTFLGSFGVVSGGLKPEKPVQVL